MVLRFCIPLRQGRVKEDDHNYCRRTTGCEVAAGVHTGMTHAPQLHRPWSPGMEASANMRH